MKIIDADAKLLDYSLANEPKEPLKFLEQIARTCYKSEDNITDKSAAKFVSGLIRRKHYAMLEHLNITYEIITKVEQYLPIQMYKVPYIRITRKYLSERKIQCAYYVTVSLSHLLNNDNVFVTSEVQSLFNLMLDTFIKKYSFNKDIFGDRLPAPAPIIVESIRIIDNFNLQVLDVTEADRLLHGSYTFKFICDRGVSHELVRHRCSFAQESTRYCNYGSNKFNNELTFIRPATYFRWSADAKQLYESELVCAESTYLCLLQEGNTPQEARAILPNCVKTEIVITAPLYQWYHIFNLRYIGTTGMPHPDMKQVMAIAMNEFEFNERIYSIYKEN